LDRCTTVIETERTLLRPLSVQDAPGLFAYRSLPEVYRYQSWVPRNLDDALSFIQRYSVSPSAGEGDWRQLGITHKAGGALIGDCGFRVFGLEQAEIGYTIAPCYQRQGLGSEVVRSLVGHLFEKLHLQRLIARTDPANVGSITILKRTGFRMAAHSPLPVETGAKWEDDLIFSMARDDWAAKTCCSGGPAADPRRQANCYT
jgi:RimJ/RimL family protein N-acetyltransferase